MLYGFKKNYSDQNIAIIAETESYSFAGIQTAAAENGPFYPISLIIEVTDGNLTIGARTNGDASQYAFDFQGGNTDRGFFKIDAFTLTEVSDLLIQTLTIGGEAVTDFDPTDVALYSVDIPAGVSELPEITATAGDGVTVEIIPATSLTGRTEIVLTSADQSYSLSYYIQFTKESDATLSSLSSSLGTLNPTFDSAIDTYELMVPYGTTSVDLDWVTTAEGATVEFFDAIGNELSADGVITWVGDGIDIEIVVTALDGTSTQTYYVSIYLDPAAENANLSDITLSAGHLTTDFDALVNEYTAIVPNGTTVVTITGVPMWSGADVQGDGELTLVDGAGAVTITVTSQDGQNTNDYIVNVYESTLQVGKDFYIQHEASQFVIEGKPSSYIKLQQPLLNSTPQLFKLVDSGVEGQYYLQNGNSEYITLTKINVSSWDMLMTDQLTQNLDSCRFEFEEFEQGKYRIITVVRKDNVEGKYYLGTNDNNVGTSIYSDKPSGADRITWMLREPSDLVDPYDSHLSSLACDQASIKPAFEPFVTEYYMTVPVGVDAIDITAIPTDLSSNITGAGAGVTVNDASGDIVITVTAPDPSNTTDYVIHYRKDTDLTLMHSYTFEDGTARDMEGSADGVVTGGHVAEGVFVSDGTGGYVTLPAAEIGINTYPSITLETYVKAGYNPGWSMLAYFGGLWGYKSYWLSVQNNDDFTRAVVDEWQGAYRAETVGEASEGDMYHYVTTMTNDSISLYINGTKVQKTLLHEDYYVADLSNENAWICYGGYNDPIWLGDVYEFNIYSGEMDEATIKARGLITSFPVESASNDATLSDLTVNGVTVEGFHSANLNYVVSVDAGSTPAIDGTVKVAGATYQVNAPESLPGVGTVVVTATDLATTVTYTIQFEVATGIGNGKESAIKVYPTVSSGEFNVEMNGKSSVISVYDLAGGLVKQIETNAKKEIIALDQKGMYIVKVDSDVESATFKVIKK
ncbi:cadherin-like beta sandwich domain-containing protein [Carboxylicivirga caseinilyticus]|uniref:cadherin-like beta sandwich domain-containing protein n=1 Tax=Carboxylicivirga caseinilyticus TaxID=3417572 RepID=UPI003D328251|nr:cadherin-like beta sandwich domain-containing protein [Marinilabiliaceae bacterium A049]